VIVPYCFVQTSLCCAGGALLEPIIQHGRCAIKPRQPGNSNYKGFPKFASNTHSWADCAATDPGMGAQLSVQIQALACGGGWLMS